jgi:tripeptidyl-peptidase-1
MWCRLLMRSFHSVTTVGATTGVPETAASLSAGGFSDYFGIPDYQARDVASYLTKLNGTNAGLFNKTGRAYPDVSAYGQNVMIASGGTNEPVDGTSCATPIFASVVALLNDRLIAAGKSPLGFLNPWLYANASRALTDITQGSNPGCNTEGFPATAGWDPVTGLGSPDFEALLATFDLK